MPQHSIIIYSLLLLFAMACSTSGRVDTMLFEAESLMMEHPDSALAILDSIRPSQLTSDRQRADYALLLTQARDKNFRFETDDSLISTAVAYFDEHPEPRKRTLAHMYRGILNLYRGNLTVAIKEALTALDLADRLNDDYIFAKTHELIADIYVAAYNFDKAITHRRLAADYYLRADKPLNNQYALVDLASAFNRIDKPNTTIAMLDSLSIEIADSTFLGFYHATYMKPLLKLKRYNSARHHSSLAEQFWGNETAELQNRPYTSYMYTLLNRLDSANYYLQLERKYNPRWDNTEEYHWAQSTLLIKKHDYENAVAELEKMWTIHDKDIKEVLKNNVAFAESDFHYNKSVAEHEKADRYHALTLLLIAIIVLICFGFFIFYRERMKRKRLELENRMLEARELTARLLSLEDNTAALKSIAAEKDIRLREQTILVNQLFRDRYKVLNNLSNEYFEKRDSDATRITIIKDFENEIAKIKHDDYLDQLKEIVDQCRDNILTRMQEQMPRFKENDITFCALILAGFSPRAICLIMDMKHGNYYNKWTRLRARIADSAAPDKEFFLTALNNKL